ncbi:MAG: DUF1799 domain-containing protein [Pseudomonadota bacterium]
MDCTKCSERQPRLLRENVDAWRLWLALQTQWRIGFNGRTGLDYNAMYLVANTLNTVINPEMLGKIQALEFATLSYQDEQAKQSAS